MRYLLDTHVLLWWRQDDPRLPRTWDPVLARPEEHEIWVSVAALWEIAIKRSLGKLRLEISLEEFGETLQSRLGFHLLPVELTHLGRLERLPWHHRDPFDRLMVAQALEEGATVVTGDPAWSRYGVAVAW